MLLRDFFQSLSYGELSNLSISGEGSGEIIEKEQNRLASLTNAALKELNSRIAYKTHYVKFQTYANEVSYLLKEGSPYLLSALDRDVHKIVGVMRMDDPATLEDEEYALLMNTRNVIKQGFAVRAVGADTLNFDNPKDGEIYIAEVRLQPALLTIPADLEEEVDVPPVLENLLTYLVCARVYSGMNGEMTVGKAQMFNGMFERALQNITDKDLLAESETDGRDRLREAGFV
tara:strand:+ start:8839 stop:9531 length:693 start_codon:yes stop_codon:yes gene_type:complete